MKDKKEKKLLKQAKKLVNKIKKHGKDGERLLNEIKKLMGPSKASSPAKKAAKKPASKSHAKKPAVTTPKVERPTDVNQPSSENPSLS
jgi:hypothetical protein